VVFIFRVSVSWNADYVFRKNSIVKAAFYDLRESESADKYQNLCSKYIQNGSSKVRFILCV
jgi:hypothetical protein